MRGVGVGLLVLLVVLTGCAVSTVGGTPAPAPEVGIVLPPRPRDIDVREIDPCDLLTEDQRAEIGLETPPLFSPSETSTLFGGPEPLCTSNAFDPRAILVAVALPYDGLGIGALTAPDRGNAERTVVDVLGFPAVLARLDDRLSCQVVVDVAPGQALSAIFRDGGRGNIPQDDLCVGAVDLADAAMSTLVALS